MSQKLLVDSFQWEQNILSINKKPMMYKNL